MTCSRWLLSLFMCVVLAAGSIRAAEGPLLSIIADREPGPAASHGLRSLTAALKAKGVACETVRSAEEARGRLLLVAGLGVGEGSAVRLLSSSGRALPLDPESLPITP